MKAGSEQCKPAKRNDRSSTGNRNPTQGSASLWWLHPFWVMAAPVLILSLIALLLPEAAYRDNWRTPKAFDSDSFGLCLAVVVVFTAGGLLASWIDAGFSPHRRFAPGPRDSRFGARELKILFAGAFAVTVFGYAIWFGSILRHGGIGMFANVLLAGEAAPDVLKQSAADSTITGVTTITQFGMGTAMLGTYLGFTQGWRKVRRPLLLLLFFTTVRAVFLSERLSLIEMALPSAVLFIRLIDYGRDRIAVRRFLAVAPIIGILGLYMLFTFTEYFRSWSTFYAGRDEQSLFAFSLLRLLGYYVTALNNGAIEWQANGSFYFPHSTMAWLWKFPLIGETLQHALGGTTSPSDLRLALMKAEGNPEFNNPSGIFTVFMDFGVPGTLLYFAVYGFTAVLLYSSYRRGSIVGLFLYSFLLTGLTDQARILYSHSGRAFPTWPLLLLVVLISRSKVRRHAPINAPSGQTASNPACDCRSG